MDINASIIDQQVEGIVEKNPFWFDRFGKDDNKRRSAAFVLLCMANYLDISLEESLEFLTEGGNDAGVDGLYIGDMEDGEFPVTLFQGKYRINDLGGKANFPENGVQKAVNTVQVLFDPAKTIELNPYIRPKVEEIRSMVLDGYIPDVRVVLCNNGSKWNDQAQGWIDRSNIPERQVRWVHFNHDSIVDILRRTKSVNDSVNLVGQALFEDFNFKRVVIGKVKVSEIGELFNRHQDNLLQRNIRRYLGLHENRVNTAIHATLLDPQTRENFYFFNNGITIICKNFRYNALQGANYQLKLENMQVINGGQTCKTIQKTLNDLGSYDGYENTYVMIRVYELADEDQDFVIDTTYATNSQNPVDLRDLRSNDPLQRQLEIGMADLGYEYKRQREQGTGGGSTITSSVVAEAVLAIWRRKPHQAKFRRKEHFGRLYDEIFRGLNPAQAIVASVIFRTVENQRKRPSRKDSPAFLPYGSHYIAMVVGKELLKTLGIPLEKLSHREFERTLNTLVDNFEELSCKAHEDISKALIKCYGERPISLQQLSATFRRGDLLEMLPD